MKQRDAFTLTELLVLVPIIGLVGAVLFASLDSDKQTLQAAQCLSNMRQWGLAMGMYCNDWHDYMPYEGSANGVDDNLDLSAWFNVLPHYINQTPLKDLYNSSPPNIPLPGQRSIYVCPSLIPGSQGMGSGSSNSIPWFGYALNRVLEGRMPSPPGKGLYKRSLAALPAQVILFSESENNSFSFTDGAFLGQVPPRHSGGMNIVFVDGHAQWYKLADYSRTANEASNALNEWIISRVVYWFPCRTCNKT
jgi:prepilin-type processing-associated H-X9-DG protein